MDIYIHIQTLRNCWPYTCECNRKQKFSQCCCCCCHWFPEPELEVILLEHLRLLVMLLNYMPTEVYRISWTSDATFHGFFQPATSLLLPRKVQSSSQCDCSCTSESACRPGQGRQIRLSNNNVFSLEKSACWIELTTRKIFICQIDKNGARTPSLTSP